MSDDQHLRVVDPGEASEEEAATAAPSRRRPSWPVLILAGAVVLVILLLGGAGVWVRDRIEALEAEAAALRTAVERRDRVIELQRDRLDDVRGGVDDVRGQLDAVRGRLESLDALLGKPLPEAD